MADRSYSPSLITPEACAGLLPSLDVGLGASASPPSASKQSREQRLHAQALGQISRISESRFSANPDPAVMTSHRRQGCPGLERRSQGACCSRLLERLLEQVPASMAQQAFDGTGTNSY